MFINENRMESLAHILTHYGSDFFAFGTAAGAVAVAVHLPERSHPPSFCFIFLHVSPLVRSLPLAISCPYLFSLHVHVCCMTSLVLADTHHTHHTVDFLPGFAVVCLVSASAPLFRACACSFLPPPLFWWVWPLVFVSVRVVSVASSPYFLPIPPFDPLLCLFPRRHPARAERPLQPQNPVSKQQFPCW